MVTAEALSWMPVVGGQDPGLGGLLPFGNGQRLGGGLVGECRVGGCEDIVGRRFPIGFLGRLLRREIQCAFHRQAGVAGQLGRFDKGFDVLADDLRFLRQGRSGGHRPEQRKYQRHAETSLHKL